MASLIIRLTDVPGGVRCETHVDSATEEDRRNEQSPALMMAAVITARLVEEPGFPFRTKPGVMAPAECPVVMN